MGSFFLLFRSSWILFEMLVDSWTSPHGLQFSFRKHMFILGPNSMKEKKS